MLDWKLITGRTGVIRSDDISLVTYALNDHEIVLIDSGWPHLKNELLSLISVKGWSVRAVLNTHLHVDHVANNAALQELYHCPAWVFRDEEPYKNVLDSIKEDLGQRAPERIQMYIDALQYDISFFESDTKQISIDGENFKIIYFPGHTPGGVGYITPDNVLAVGDACLSKGRLLQSKLPFYENPAQAMDTFRYISTLKYDYLVIAHNDVVPGSEISELMSLNIEHEKHIWQAILDGWADSDNENDNDRVLRDRVLDTIKVRHDMADRSWVDYTLQKRIDDLRSLGMLQKGHER